MEKDLQQEIIPSLSIQSIATFSLQNQKVMLHAKLIFCCVIEKYKIAKNTVICLAPRVYISAVWTRLVLWSCKVIIPVPWEWIEGRALGRNWNGHLSATLNNTNLFFCVVLNIYIYVLLESSVFHHQNHSIGRIFLSYAPF